MNTQKVLQLAALLRMPETNDHFHMGYWIHARGRQEHQKAMEALHTCGTTACIAGWAVSMEMPNIRVAEMRQRSIADLAMDILGLDEDAADALFEPDSYGVSYPHVTNQIAAGVLENLAETGEVVWPPEVLIRQVRGIVSPAI